MNENESLEKIYRLAQEAGLNAADIAEYFSARESDTSSETKAYEAPTEVLPGMFVYADGLIYPEIIPRRQIKAIVASVIGQTAYAVCLKENKLPWSRDLLNVPETQNLDDGREATSKILEATQKANCHAEAAQFCFDYVEDGVKQGEAFLPSVEEWKKIFANKEVVNASIVALISERKNKKALGDEPERLGRSRYWSSNESSEECAIFCLKDNCGANEYCFKEVCFLVRPVLKIQL